MQLLSHDNPPHKTLSTLCSWANLNHLSVEVCSDWLCRKLTATVHNVCPNALCNSYVRKIAITQFYKTGAFECPFCLILPGQQHVDMSDRTLWTQRDQTVCPTRYQSANICLQNLLHHLTTRKLLQLSTRPLSFLIFSTSLHYFTSPLYSPLPVATVTASACVCEFLNERERRGECMSDSSWQTVTSRLD